MLSHCITKGLLDVLIGDSRFTKKKVGPRRRADFSCHDVPVS